VDAVAGYAVLLFFAYSFSWVMACIGLSVRAPEVVNNASFMVLFPMTFISNTFVPSENLPGILRTIAEWNPISTLTQATREQFGNIPFGTPAPTAWPLQNSLLYTMLWAILLIVVFAPLATKSYARSTSR
jgi:ABC-type multidrug transport system permease subunit